MSKKDNMTTVLKRAIRYELASLQTCYPAIIVSYDYKTQMASVQPAVNKLYRDGRIDEFPIIHRVPVVFPQSGGAVMHFPVKKGDTVMLLFSSREIETWLNRGGKVTQTDTRMHDLNDAIAIPGLMPFNSSFKAKNNTDVLIKFGDAEVEMKSSGEINMKSPNLVTIDSPEATMTGNLVVKGDISDKDGNFGTIASFRSIYNGHTHTEQGDGAPTSAPNQAWD